MASIFEGRQVDLGGALDNLIDLFLFLSTNGSVFTKEVLAAMPHEVASYTASSLEVQLEDCEVVDYSHLHKPLGLEGKWTMLSSCYDIGDTSQAHSPVQQVTLVPSVTAAMLMLLQAQAYYKVEETCGHIWFETLYINEADRTFMVSMGS